MVHCATASSKPLAAAAAAGAGGGRPSIVDVGECRLLHGWTSRAALCWGSHEIARWRERCWQFLRVLGCSVAASPSLKKLRRGMQRPSSNCPSRGIGDRGVGCALSHKHHRAYVWYNSGSCRIVVGLHAPGQALNSNKRQPQNLLFLYFFPFRVAFASTFLTAPSHLSYFWAERWAYRTHQVKLNTF